MMQETLAKFTPSSRTHTKEFIIELVDIEGGRTIHNSENQDIESCESSKRLTSKNPTSYA